MRTSTRRLLRSLPLLAALGCGGGGDGSPPDTPVIILSQSSLNVIEGTPDTLTVVLDAAPPANVSVSLSSAGRVTLLPTTLDFTPANFATPKFVIVTAIQDIDLAAGSDTVTATAAGLVTVKIPVAIADNDSQAVVLDSTLLSILEGDSVSYDVKLAYQPLASVNVTLTPTDTFVVVTPTTLNFTPADYATPKSVKVRAKQDQDLVADTLHIVASVPSGQSASIPVNITDNDIQAIQTDLGLVNVTEGDSTQLGVRLAFQPGGDVVVGVASLSTADATVTPSTLTFTTANYNTYQYPWLRGTQDVNVAAGNTTVRLTTTGVANKDVSVNVADDDTLAFVTSVDTVFATEGLGTSLKITLAYQPSSVVSVFLGDFATAVATVTPTSSTLGPASYTAGFTVTITGTEDANTVTDETHLWITGGGIAPKLVVIIVADND